MPSLSVVQTEYPEDIVLPYLAIEADGNPYPQVVQARLEVFALQARRAFELMNKYKVNINPEIPSDEKIAQSKDFEKLLKKKKGKEKKEQLI